MRHVLDYIKKNPLVLLVIVPGLIYHMLIIMPSGSPYCVAGKCGIFFWGPHGHDALWHLAIAETSFNKVPFVTPTFAGGILRGYNFLLDYIMFIFSKVGISPIITYFKILPVIWFTLLTGVTIILGRKIKDSPLFVSLLLFFFYFGGSFGYLLTYMHRGTIAGSEGLLAMQSGHTLINIQYAFSLVVILFLLTLIIEKKSDTKTSLLISFLVFVNLGLKFYAGVITLFMVGLYYFHLFLISKKKVVIFLQFLPSVVAAALALLMFYDPISSSKTGPSLIFSPFAIVHSMIEERDLLYMRDMVDQRYYLASKGFGLRLLRIDLISVLLYFFFNFGTRIIGFYYLIKSSLIRKIRFFDFLIFTTIIFSITLAVLFIQKGEWWNTVQFFYYAIFLMNIFAALGVYELLRQKNAILYLFVAALILFTLPTSYDLISQFTYFPSPSYLPQNEITALKFLRKLPDGVVLTDSYNKKSKEKYTVPIPLFAYDDTSYVSAISGKQTYLNDLVQLRLTGIDYSKREKELVDSGCPTFESIRYIYVRESLRFRECLDNKNIKVQEIYNKDEVKIYEIISTLRSQ